MPSDELYAKASKVLELKDKLDRLRMEGKVDDDKYAAGRKMIDEHLIKLREANLEYMGGRIETLGANIARYEAQKAGGLMSADSIKSMTNKAAQEKSDLESDRDMLELYSSDEYLEYLKKHLGDFKSAVKTDAPAATSAGMRLFTKPEADGGDYDAPTWAKAVALVVVGLYLILGLLSFSLVGIIVFPLIAIFGIGLSVALMHAATLIVGVERPSPERAFTAIMLNLVLNVAASICLLVLMAAYVIATAASGLSGLSLQSILSTLLVFQILGAIMGLAIGVYSIYRVYNTPIWKAIAVIVASVILVFVFAVIVFVAMMVLGLSAGMASH